MVEVLVVVMLMVLVVLKVVVLRVRPIQRSPSGRRRLIVHVGIVWKEERPEK